MRKRQVHNFSAGPAVLPASVLQQAQAELLDWSGTGVSVMEIGHRTPEFMAMLEKTEADFRELLEIPANYQVLFLTGSARSQFSAIPMNLLGQAKRADYLDTGLWSNMAVAEAQRYCQVNVVANAAENNYTAVPDPSTWNLDPKAAYLHYTPNETVNGIEFPDIPDVGDVPLVADMTSAILTQPLDVSRFGVIYAGTQKTIAPAGLTIVIVRDDLLDRQIAHTPTVWSYAWQSKHRSLYHTPASFNCYIAGLTFTWVRAQGGLSAMAALNQRKAEKFYSYIDKSDFYHNKVMPKFRSRLNVPFTLAENRLEETFLEQAKAAGFLGLRGHKNVGGIRVSMYNAMPEASVDALIEFMQDFYQQKT